MGIAEWFDKEAGEGRRGVSGGEATVAMILNVQGFSNRQMYLVPKLEVDQQEVTVLARKKAAFIVAINILDAQRLSHEQVISTFKEL